MGRAILPWRVRRLFNATTDLLTTLKVMQWKTAYRCALKFRRRRVSPDEEQRLRSGIHKLENVLPNTGGIPLAADAFDPYAISSESRSHMGKRRTELRGFEGLALDDALIFTNSYKEWSFFRLARVVARLLRGHLGRNDISVLELGCGGGLMRRFLGAFGIVRYLGVDANPIAFFHSPHIQEAPRHYRCLDLQQGVDFRYTFDAVCSFEVLEHIREDAMDAVLASIRRHMGHKSLFLGTASLCGGMDVHITVHDREWWLARFEQHKLRQLHDHVRWETLLQRNHPFNWNKSNTSVFVLEAFES